MDIGSMDGSDSRRFRALLKHSDIVAFEANPDNFNRMTTDYLVIQDRIRVVNKMVSQTNGTQSFYIQRPVNSTTRTNRGTSSALPRKEIGMENVQVNVESVRIDSILEAEYPKANSVALWVDVEGFAYDVLESLSNSSEKIALIHVEVETQECWPGQRLEPEVVQLLEGMGLILLARGKNDLQRDLLFIHKNLYSESQKQRIDQSLQIARRIGPTLSKVLTFFPH